MKPDFSEIVKDINQEIQDLNPNAIVNTARIHLCFEAAYEQGLNEKFNLEELQSLLKKQYELAAILSKPNIIVSKEKIKWPTPSESHEEFKSCWTNYPSQDNEGYQPDRGGFKAGWNSAYHWLKSRVEEMNK